MPQNPFKSSSTRAEAAFDLIHIDLMGPMEVQSVVYKSRYVLVIVDDCTRYNWVYFLKNKDDAEDSLRSFFSFVKTQHKSQIKTIRSDNGGEFSSNSFIEWLESEGVRHNLTISYTPQQNGVAERFNRTLQERARAMLFGSGLPVRFWEHAMRYASWCINRLPTSALPDMGLPFTALRGKPPNLAMARTFGCMAHVWIPEERRDKGKFTRRAEWGAFIGIPLETKGWEFYLPESEVVGFLSRNAYFHENTPYSEYALKPSRKVHFSDDLPPVTWENSFPTCMEPPLEDSKLLDPPGEPEGALTLPHHVTYAPHSVSSPVDHVHGLGTVPDGSEDPVPLVVSDGGGFGGLKVPVNSFPTDVGQDTTQLHQRELSEHLIPEPEGPVLQHDACDPTVEESSEGFGQETYHREGLDQGDQPDAARLPPRVRQPPLRLVPTLKGPYHQEARGSAPLPPTGQAHLLQTGGVGYVLPHVRRPVRPPLVTYTSHNISWQKGAHTNGSAYVVAPNLTWNIPQTVKQADASPHSDEFREARHKELDRCEELCVWTLDYAPPGAKILGCRWVFTVKLNPDRTINKFKARLVVQGFTQEEGIDFDEVYANTAGRATIRVFFALVAALDLHCHQMDVTTAFLYGDVDRPLFMKQPPGHDDGTGRVCRLKKALYGLKQAPRIWSETLKRALLEFGFKVSQMDPSLYLLNRADHIVYLLDYVDDMLIASKSLEQIDWVKKQLCSRFKMTDLGETSKYVGMIVHRDRPNGELWLHQADKVLELATRCEVNLQGKLPDTPLPANFVLFHPWEVKDPEMDLPHGHKHEPLLSKEDHQRYREIVGSLQYLAHATRVDLAYAAQQLSRVNHCPRKRHLDAALRCTAYLAGTAELGIHFSRQGGTLLECYVDANHCPDPTRKSISGILLQLAGGPVYWTSRKQDRVTTSTCDSEAQAVMVAVQYVQQLRDLCEELQIMQIYPTAVFNDNSATVRLCVDPVAHKKSVQLTRAMAYVRENTLYGVIAPIYVSTKDMPADFLTKRLAPEQFEYCRLLSGMLPLPPSHLP